MRQKLRKQKWGLAGDLIGSSITPIGVAGNDNYKSPD